MTPATLGCRCEECPFAVKGKDGKPTHQGEFVLPRGPAKPAGVVWCDLPNHDDARRGVPMTPNSPTGKEWDKSLMQAGLKREDLLHVPATACKKPHSVKDSSVGKAIVACTPMRETAKALSDGGVPTLVAGKFAWTALTGQKDGSGSRRGFVEGNRCVTHRPEMAYFWNPYELESFEADISRFGRLIRGELDPAPNITITDVRVDEIYTEALHRGWVAFDIETMPCSPEEPWTGKDPTRALLRTLSFGWEDRGFAVFWSDLSEHSRRVVRSLLSDPEVKKVGMNIIWFDNRVLARYGMTVAPFEDCRDLRRAISSTSRLSLGYQATLYTDAPPWKAEQDAESEDANK